MATSFGFSRRARVREGGLPGGSPCEVRSVDERGEGGVSWRLNEIVRTAIIRSADERQDAGCPIRVSPVQTTSPLVREAPWASYPGCRARDIRAAPDVEAQYRTDFEAMSRPNVPAGPGEPRRDVIRPGRRSGRTCRPSDAAPSHPSPTTPRMKSRTRSRASSRWYSPGTPSGGTKLWPDPS